MSVLLIGKSRRVLDEAVAGLRELGYEAEGTNDFADITRRFEAATLDVVVFGGQVPPDLKAELQQAIAAVNPQVSFVQGLSGIPGLIIRQVQAALATPRYWPADRSIRLTLARPAQVLVTAWWQTSFVPPDPGSASLVLLDDHLAAGDHAIAIPDRVPPRAAFATVEVDGTISAFSIAAAGAISLPGG